MVKKIAILCFAVSSLGTLMAQSYYPFPMDSAYWSVEEYFYGWFPEPDGCITRHYGIFKDSSLNGFTYSTLLGNNIGGPPYHDTAFNYSSAIEVAQVRREDSSQKIWVNDVLYYDFSLNLGDNFCFDYWPNAGCGFVWLIDSITIDGNPRRRMNFNTNTNPETWIEGIGSTTGWFEWQWTGSWGWTVTCFYEKDKLVYGTSYSCHCNTYTGITNARPSERITIQMGQNSTKIQIAKPEKFQEITVNVHSLDGKVVQQWLISQSQVSLDIGHIAQGMFIVLVQGKDGIVARKKVVKLSP